MTKLERDQHEMLKWLEWTAGEAGDEACPVCKGVQPQHEDGCELAGLLMEVDRRKFAPGLPPAPGTCPECGSEASYASAGTEAQVRAHPVEWHTWVIQEGDAG